MRIITRRRIYRAFPELDRFSDQQCEWLLQRVRLSRARIAQTVASGVLAGLLGLIVMGAALVSTLRHVDERSIEIELVVRDLAWLYSLGWGIVLTLVFSMPSLLALLARDLTLGTYLKMALRGQLKRRACPDCRYQLIGQQVDESGGLRCPECGRRTTLGELGLDGPEDLLPALAAQPVS